MSKEIKDSIDNRNRVLTNEQEKQMKNLMKGKTDHMKFLYLIQHEQYDEARKLAIQISQQEPNNSVMKQFSQFLQQTYKELPYLSNVEDEEQDQDSDKNSDDDEWEWEYYDDDEKQGQSQEQKNQNKEEEEEEEEEEEDEGEEEYEDDEEQSEPSEYFDSDEEKEISRLEQINEQKLQQFKI
ncbi:hypothetical protein PPERSA_08689 [Pseudocohnilembus persalinus]|uniref:Uncharacterized protein n=1 Tax=Pseudocohnilembus persalinus TaxID=266149 RepID=A0A0V0R877_PSEPJ|nr:hypothetical protein PPERSA_08689 [Pseudocohnilembus persalinus]|eukprot:KRX10694.1 hypothetical protein PPERSA_08689 [Pseudocohnilembus persalinus]